MSGEEENVENIAEQPAQPDEQPDQPDEQQAQHDEEPDQPDEQPAEPESFIQQINSRAADGDSRGLRRLLDSKEEERARMRKTSLLTALQSAAENLDVDCYKLLVEAGAPLDRFYTGKRRSSLHIALKRREDDEKKILTIINIALDNYRKDSLVKFVNTKDKCACTPLFYAAKYGHTACIKRLVDCGAEVNLPSTYDKLTPLLEAAERGQDKSVDLLIELGSNLKHKNLLGETALHCAARRGSAACIRILLQNGCNPNQATPNKEVPIMFAAASGNYDAVNELLQYGAKVDRYDGFGKTSLWYCANYGYDNIANLLTDKMAEVGFQSKDYSLLVATARDDVTLVKMLLKMKWNLVVEDASGNNVIAVCALKNSYKCLEVFLSDEYRKNYDLDKPGSHSSVKMPPLHMALLHGHTEVAILLLKAGANANALDDGQTAPCMCPLVPSHNHKLPVTTLKLLLRYGSDVNIITNPKISEYGHLYHLKDDTPYYLMYNPVEWAAIVCQPQILKMFYVAGCPLGEAASWDDLTLPKSDIFPHGQIRHHIHATTEEMIAEIQKINKPRELQEIARLSIRASMRTDVQDKIDVLELPPHLKDFVNLEELDRIEAEYNYKNKPQLFHEEYAESDPGSSSSVSFDEDEQ